MWEILEKKIKKDLKKGKDLSSVLDLVYFQFYLKGQFGHKLPVEEGRKMTEIILRHFEIIR